MYFHWKMNIGFFIEKDYLEIDVDQLFLFRSRHVKSLFIFFWLPKRLYYFRWGEFEAIFSNTLVYFIQAHLQLPYSYFLNCGWSDCLLRMMNHPRLQTVNIVNSYIKKCDEQDATMWYSFLLDVRVWKCCSNPDFNVLSDKSSLSNWEMCRIIQNCIGLYFPSTCCPIGHFYIKENDYWVLVFI